MLKNYFKIAVRSLLKNKSYVIINILGMGTAIACCIVAYLNYDFNAKFDQYNANFDEIYHVVTVRDYNDAEQPYGIVPLQFTEMVSTQVSGVDNVLRLIPSYASLQINEEIVESNILFSDQSLTDLFSFEIVKGSGGGPTGTSLLISESASEKYFGAEDPIGKTVEHIVNDQPVAYEVSGVYRDLPENSSLEFVEAIAHIDNYKYIEEDLYDRPWNYWTTTFLQISDPQQVSNVEAQLAAIVPVQNEAREDFKALRFELMPLKGMADRAQNSNIWAMWLRGGVPAAAIMGPAVMAIMLMLLACFNYTNTSIAMAGRRLKEIGLRKVMGGMQKQVMTQFIIENMVLCLGSLLVGLVIAELIIPYYNAMWDFVSLDIDYFQNTELLLFLIALLILVGLIAGSYPSYYISRFEATPILRGTIKFGGNTMVSKVLLVLQLSISLIAIISAFAFLNNAKYQKEIDLGFNKEQVLYTYIDNGKEYDQLANALAGYDEIELISGTQHHLLSSATTTTFTRGDKDYQVESYRVGFDYFDMMDIELIDGEGFKRDSRTDIEESVIVNEMFLDQFNLEDPIGTRLTVNDTVNLYVVGVAKNAYTNALWGPIEPVMFMMADKQDYSRILLKTTPENLLVAHEILGKEYSSLFPYRIYNGRFMNEDLAEDSMINKNIVTIFIFLGLVALILSVTGLYAMISLNLQRKTKEIGVRKVLGASVPGLVSKLNKPFVIITLIAVSVGCVGAYFLVDSLLGMIWEYYAPPQAAAMILGSLILVLVALVTVTGKVFRAATVNPVLSLRSE